MLSVRGFALGTVGCAIIAVAVAPAGAQMYPARAVRLVVPNAPGSSGDIVARLLSPPLSERLGQPIIVDNRAGAGTMIGGEVVAKAAPDGYTLLLGLSTLAINPGMYKKLPYDALRDFAPVTQLVSLPALLITHPSLPARSIKALVALAKARPEHIVFASTGHGSFSHVATELFASTTGIRMLHVPYKGTGPGLAALASGEVSLMTSNVLSALPHARSGRVRALGVTGSKRSASAPDIPTVAEAGVPGYEAVQWMGLLAPASTPGDIIARLYKDASAVVRSADLQERLQKDGADTVVDGPAEFAAYIRSETIKWTKALKAAGIRPE